MRVPLPGLIPNGIRTGAELWKNSLLKRRLSSRLAITLIISLFFHLSMFTVFQIVIVIPMERIKYHELRIIRSSATTPETAEGPPAIREGDTLALSGSSHYDSLPAVDLPVLEFAELERLRIRSNSVDPPENIQEYLEAERPTDSWARFSGELQRLGKTLRAITFPGQDIPAPVPAVDNRKHLVHRPAEGFEAYIEWNGPPTDRELLFSPPIRALWELNPAALNRPYEIVFKVDVAGRVINVWSPILDESGAVDEIQMTLLQYRFSPLTGYGPEESSAPTAEQSGVLFIQAAGGQP